MKKEVSITIEGLQLGTEEEPVVTTTVGTYHLYNDKHYIQYEEPTENGVGTTKTTLKIGLTKVELSKKGSASSVMTFDLNEMTQAIYQTQFGNLFFEVKTSEITVQESEEFIDVDLKYVLFTNEVYLSDNQIKLRINSL